MPVGAPSSFCPAVTLQYREYTDDKEDAVSKGQRPSYQDALRAIGRYFDRNVYRHVLVAEVDDGYVARAFPGHQSSLKAEGIALPMADVLALIAAQDQGRDGTGSDVKMPSLLPTGYEDFFRSLGYEMDVAKAGFVTLVELSTGILVSYAAKGAKGGLERAQRFYDPPRIDDLLTQGYQRRAASEATA